MYSCLLILPYGLPYFQCFLLHSLLSSSALEFLFVSFLEVQPFDKIFLLFIDFIPEPTEVSFLSFLVAH